MLHSFNKETDNDLLNMEDFDANPFLTLVPPGYTGHMHIPSAMPPRVMQSVNVYDIGALEDYLTHQVVSPLPLAVYVNMQSREIVAVLDHAATAEAANSNQHVVALRLAFSEDFAPIHAVLGKELGQQEFMDFLEEHASVFVEAARINQLISTFENVIVTRLKSSRNLDNGTGQLVYSTEEDEEVSTRVPRDVSTKMAIFRGQPDVTLALRLRYCARNGKVVFQLLCHGLEKIIREEVMKVELRLRTWLAARGGEEEASAWKGVLVCRVAEAVALRQPTERKWIELKSTALPAGLGNTATSSVEGSSSKY